MLGLNRGGSWKGIAARVLVAGAMVATACSLNVVGVTDEDVDVETSVVPAAPGAEATVEIPRPETPVIRPDENELVPPAPAQEGDIAAAPTFTPFTVAPSITNRLEVIQAMEQSYPPLLREAGVSGTVRVYFFIDAEGVVQKSIIDRSSGHPALDDAALRVADVYRFTPALNRDEKVPVWVSFPITFMVK